MCIAIICLPRCDVKNVEIIYLFNQALFLFDQKSRQKIDYLENKMVFYGEIKSIFHHFKGLLVAEIYLRVRL